MFRVALDEMVPSAPQLWQRALKSCIIASQVAGADVGATLVVVMMAVQVAEGTGISVTDGHVADAAVVVASELESPIKQVVSSWQWMTFEHLPEHAPVRSWSCCSGVMEGLDPRFTVPPSPPCLRHMAQSMVGHDIIVPRSFKPPPLEHIELVPWHSQVIPSLSLQLLQASMQPWAAQAVAAAGHQLLNELLPSGGQRPLFTVLQAADLQLGVAASPCEAIMDHESCQRQPGWIRCAFAQHAVSFA